MYLWNYDADFHLIDTTSPNRDIIADISFDGTLKKHLASGKRTPLILETRIGLVWIAGFSYQSDKLCGIHLLGPSFAGRDTHMILLKKLNTYDLSVKVTCCCDPDYLRDACHTYEHTCQLCSDASLYPEQ